MYICVCEFVKMCRDKQIYMYVMEVQYTLRKRGTNSVCTNNGTRGQSIARLKLPVDMAETQAPFNNLSYITNIFQILITISKQIPNK